MKKMTSMVLALGGITCMCTGCGNGEKTVELNQPYNVSFVTVIANNNPVLDTGINELAQLSEAVGSTYSCILADAVPNVICEGTVPDFGDKGFSKDMINRAQASVAADIIGQLDAAAPDNDEVDIAAATSLAVRKLRSEQVEGRENILVYYGSGISTSGLIDMRTVPLSDLDVDTSAKELAEVMDLDLSGIRVIWYCCGDVAGDDQLPLSDNEKRIDKDFYRAWLTNMGADEVVFMDNVSPDGCYSFGHQVSVMKTEGTQFGLSAKTVLMEEAEESEEEEVTEEEEETEEAEESEVEEVTEAAEESKVEEVIEEVEESEVEEVVEEVEESERNEVIEEVFADGDIVTFDDKSVAFLPDSTELAAPDDAMEALGYVISYMNDHPDFTLMVCGTTTSATDPVSSIAFSEKRAQAIRSLLVEKAGIDENRIVTLGCGWSSCLYIDDRDEAGNLNEKAPLNRSVKLVDYNSAIAADIIQSLNE